MKLFNILQKCHNSIFILHCFISTSKKSAPDIMHSQKKKETNKQRKITIKLWLCIFSRNHFMHCSLSRYWSCSSWRAEVHCAWWSYSSFNFILTTRETCTWARMWISSGVSRKWNIGCGVTKLPIEWPNLFTTKRKACLLAASESSHAVNLMKYKSLQKKTWKVLLCFQLLRQNTSYIVTVPRKKKLNIIIYVSGQKIYLVWNFISFSQGMVRTSKQVQFKRKQKKHDRTCILFPRCSDTDFMQTREPFLFVGRK